MQVRVPVTRKTYEDLIRPDMERAVQICKTLLKNNRRTPRDMQRLILVGGPSHTPLVKQMLSENIKWKKVIEAAKLEPQ